MSYNSITNMSYSTGDLIAKAERYIATELGNSFEPSFSIQENVGLYSRGVNLLSLAVDGATPLEISKTQVTSINGTLTQPAYSFTSDLSSGMYLESKGVVAVNANDFKVSGTINSNLTVGSDIKSTVPFWAPAGTLAAPAYSFTADSNTGLYNEADGKISVSCNGTKVMSMSPTLIELFAGVSLTGLFANGTATAPSISFTSDTDTGFYHQTSGSVAYAADGKDIITLDIDGIKLKDGSIGYPSMSFASNPSIGLYKAGSYLSIAEAGSKVAEFSHTDIKTYSQILAPTTWSSTPSYSFQNSPGTGIYSTGAGQMTFGVATYEKLLITNSTIEAKTRIKIPTSTILSPEIYSTDSVGWTSGIYTLDNKNGQIGFSISGNDILACDTAKTVSTVAIQNIDGTKIVPAYAFSSNSNSGMYLGSGFVGISYTGSDIFSAYPTETITKGRCRADSFYFRLDPNTGISNDNPSEFNFYGGGVVKAVIQNNGFIRASGGFHGTDGSVADPAFTFNSDYSTGMFLGPAYLGFSYNGSLMFDITNAGAYTIGYSRADSFDFRNDNQSGMYLYSGPPSSDVRIRCAGTDCASFRSGKLIAFKNNSTSVPTISWNHDLTTGFNSWLAGGINMVCGGTERVQVGTSFIIPAYTNGISNGLSNYAWAACYSYGYYSPSDRRLKSDIVDCDLGLDFINAIRPVQYRWNDRVRTHRGFISQEIKAVCDQLNIAGENSNNIGFWGDNSINTPERTPEIPPDDQQSIVYTEFIPILTKAIQELSRRVEALENN